MAHFAEIDSNNEVVRVIVVDDNDVANNGGEASAEAAAFVGTIAKLASINNSWVQFSADGSFRQRPAGIGGTYDSTKNVFIDKKPYSSWSLNDNNVWVAPVTYSNTEYNGRPVHVVKWDEVNQKWLALDLDVDNDTATNLEWDTGTSAWVVA